MTTYPWPGNLYKWCRGYFIWFFGSMSYVEDSFGRKWDKIWMAAMGGWGGGGGEKYNFTRIFTTTGLDWNVPVDLFIFSIFFYSYHAQTSLLRIKWFQFPLTSYFSPWSVTLWNADLLYDRSFSVPTNHLKQTNINSSTKKIRLTSATNRQAVAHKSRLARYFPSTPGFSCKNLHNFHGFNHSHSQSSHQKDISIPTPLSSFSSFK